MVYFGSFNLSKLLQLTCVLVSRYDKKMSVVSLPSFQTLEQSLGVAGNPTVSKECYCTLAFARNFNFINISNMS